MKTTEEIIKEVNEMYDNITEEKKEFINKIIKLNKNDFIDYLQKELHKTDIFIQTFNVFGELNEITSIYFMGILTLRNTIMTTIEWINNKISLDGEDEQL